MAWHIAVDEPASFELLLPASVPEALEQAAKRGSAAAFLAGGCDLLEQMKLQWRDYRYLINLKTIPGLAGIEVQQGVVRLGALTRLGDMERHAELRQALPGLVSAAGRVATPQIRNMGTLGGNLLQDSRCPYYRGPWHCYRAGGIVCDALHGLHSEHAIFGADRCITVTPSDTAPMLVALEAIAAGEGPRGRWRRSVHELFMPPGENIRTMHRLGRDEILTGIEIPRRGLRKSAFIKYAQRNSWDFAIASVAVAFDEQAAVARNCRIVLGAVAAIPWRSTPAEEVIEGQRLTPEVIERAAQAATRGAQPLAHNEYKVALVRKLVRSALSELAPR
jgi:xanthine dehydrogenase YagS FAD-binding subunit